MKITIFILSLLIGTAIHSQRPKDYFKVKDSTIKSIEIFRCLDDPTINAVICEWERDWWEELSIVKTWKGQILWEARFDSTPQEQSIRSVKELKLRGHKNLFFQVYGQTHMGNGSYYLYELQGRNMVLRAATRAVDLNFDGGTLMEGSLQLYNRIFKNDTLTASYKDINGDGLIDIELTGIIQIIDDYNRIIKSYHCRKVLLYSESQARFIEDKNKRIGFNKDDD